VVNTVSAKQISVKIQRFISVQFFYGQDEVLSESFNHSKKKFSVKSMNSLMKHMIEDFPLLKSLGKTCYLLFLKCISYFFVSRLLLHTNVRQSDD
jgi:hypothetical protein